MLASVSLGAGVATSAAQTFTYTGTAKPVPSATAKPSLSELLRGNSTARAYPLGYLASLDGVRGLMTLGVLAAHTRILLFPGAIVFMDAFFAMSGYLITSLLINEFRRTGKIDFVKFYLRRLKRLYPALIAMLILSLIVAAIFSQEFWMRVIDEFVALTYISNYWRAYHMPGLWYNTHTWSLSLEEQFYIIWPLTFVLLMRCFRLSWTMVLILVAMALGFWAWRIYLTFEGASIERLYNSFDTRADSLLFGCALAIVLKLFDLSSHPQLCKMLAWSLLPLSALGIFWGLKINDHMRWYYIVSPLMGSIPAALCVASLVQPQRIFMHTIYEHPAPVFLGRICYGLYIWHYPVFSLLRGKFEQPYIGVFLIGWPVAFGLALTSYFLIERRFMRARPV